MHWLLYLAIGVSILAMRGHATEIWCIFGDKYVRCTLISVAAKGDQSISCNPRFLLHGNILCRGRFLPMDIMKRCLQGITLNLTSPYWSSISQMPKKLKVFHRNISLIYVVFDQGKPPIFIVGFIFIFTFVSEHWDAKYHGDNCQLCNSRWQQMSELNSAALGRETSNQESG